MKRYSVTTGIIFCLCVMLQQTNGQQHATVTTHDAQTSINKKYPSLLWQITGNGLKKPSYLFGTMHISDKLVFNLGDSFYNAIKGVDVVAIEQDPQVWQEAYSSESDEEDNDDNDDDWQVLNSANQGIDHLMQQTFALSPYESKIKIALASEARMANSMLYRNESGMEDFEENTYLDMYIYRLGYKLKKTVTGVENYKETNRIVKEAYLAMYKDKNLKQNRYNFDSQSQVEDAYRQGNLDVLDSLEKLSVTSDAFEEKFLYKRNEIQAHSIDTILKKNSLFVAVGVAHLPGKKGVIELLRQKGYTLRAVTMDLRDVKEKDKMDEIRVPVKFSKQFSEDSLFSVSVPGKKLYKYNTFSDMSIMQYADMPNGSYCTVMRVGTDASLRGQTSATVLKKIDSLLYENIPGRITSKKLITKNGFSGYEILNTTRKGDEQRYNIYVLPDEIIFFKMAGLGNYIDGGNEANEFFSSISFDTTRKNFQPVAYESPYGGFKATFPSKPYFTSQKANNKTNEWISSDDHGNTFFVFKTNLHQYDYIEEDSFELRLMEESFLSSPMFKDAANGTFSTWNKYPVLNAMYKHTDGSSVKLRYLIQGNNYYVFGVKYKTDAGAADKFINSFSLTPYYYGEVKKYADTSLGFTVNSPVFYKIKKDSSDNLSMANLYAMRWNDDQSNFYNDILHTVFKKVAGNDTTGEYVDITSIHLPKYSYYKDSASLMQSYFFQSDDDSDFIKRFDTNYITADKWKCHYYQFGDTGSSRIITIKTFYKNGVLFNLSNMADTISSQSYFVKNFFESFTPADTFNIVDPLKKKSDLFFADYFSNDSTTSKKAEQSITASVFDSSDLPQIKKAINSLSWKKKNYLSLKENWIDVVGSFHDDNSVKYLTQLYHDINDTAELQQSVIGALLQMRTLASFNAFKDLVLANPPAVADNDDDDDARSRMFSRFNIQLFMNAAGKKALLEKALDLDGKKWAPLYDTLALSAKIIPALFDLVTLDDYKDDIIDLTATAVDSGYIKADDYKQYFNKLLLEGKQLLKKEAAKEDAAELEKLTRKDDNQFTDYFEADDDDNNKDLENYQLLLMPFWEHSGEVPALFEKSLQLKNKQLKLNAAVLMLRNKRNVPDSILLSLAADDVYRIQLYKQLKDAKLTDKFPAKYRTQFDIAKSALYNRTRFSMIDSIVYINKIPVNQRKYNGWVYFFKYKAQHDDDWQIGSSGLQPFDSTKINTDFDEDVPNFVDVSDEDYTEPILPVLQKIIKKQLYALRKSASEFYKDDDYSNVSVQEAKMNRYQ